jgi:hypothetical protein
MSIHDYASGKDRSGQSRENAIKTADGSYWWPTDMSPMQAVIAGVTLGYKRGDKICDK